MTEPHILDTIEQQARSLLAEKLRSTAVLIARLFDLICQANHLGYTHKTIHQRLRAAGLTTSLNSYSMYLYRAKCARIKAAVLGAQDARPGAPAPDVGERAPVAPSPAAAPPASASATGVRDALAQASAVAQTDYAQIARNSLRKPRK